MERKVVDAKSCYNQPNYFGILGAIVTLPFGVAFEDKKIRCGNCDTIFTKNFVMDDLSCTTCPACNVMNRL